MSSAASVEDLEIVAGYVWNAVGGVGAVGGVDQGTVEVKQVDPKRFGVEVCAGTSVEWAAGDEGDVRQIELATLRAFKPMDVMVIERQDNGAGVVAIVTGLTRTRIIEIGGINQFTAKNPINNAVFGTVLSAPRPKIRFDTVQTSPSLTADLEFVGGTIGASSRVIAEMVFGGVAVKR
jgi:hypothetical protein